MGPCLLACLLAPCHILSLCSSSHLQQTVPMVGRQRERSESVRHLVRAPALPSGAQVAELGRGPAPGCSDGLGRGLTPLLSEQHLVVETFLFHVVLFTCLPFSQSANTEEPNI